ncbi:MAG: amidohydrolase family protein [Candidatus Bathyarchaeia archaeon]
MFDLIIKGGRVVDGAGNQWYRSDVAVAGGRIAAIGKLGSDAERVIDAAGLVVAPGFIDTHSHSDLMLMAEPEARQKIMQGVTTEVVGQDGLGEAPLRDDVVDDWRRYLSGLNGDPDIEWSWRSFAGYLERLEAARPATNVASLVGHGNLRLLAMGMENRRPTSRELGEMKGLLAEAMGQGAFGLSTGLIYPPCVYADAGELMELCRVGASFGGIFVVHMRDEGDRLLESIDEVAAVGREAGVSVHISHFKVSGDGNWGRAAEAVERVERARREGVEVTVDQYPYTAGSTFLSSLLPAWTHEGGTARMLERLRDEATRGRIVADMMASGRVRGTGWSRILVTSVKTEGNKGFEGRSVEEIAEARGQTPVDAVLDIILEEENAATMVSFSMSEEDVRTIMRSPFQMVCTDGIVLGRPHPRAYGSFPRVLGRYVRDGVLRLEEAVRKMTSLPAQTFGLRRRGLLRPGMWADIAIFDPDSILDRATYKDPIRFPAGVEYVIVNGEVTVEGGEHTGTRAGRVLRRGGPPGSWKA